MNRSEYMDVLNTRDKPLLDATSLLIGRTPLSRFKKKYNDIKNLGTESLYNYVDKYKTSDKMTELAPYLFELGNRGVLHEKYNPVGTDYVRNLMDSSGIMSNDNINQRLLSGITLTSIAGLNVARDHIAKKNRLASFEPSTQNIDLAGYAPWRGLKHMGDPYTIRKMQLEESLSKRFGKHYDNFNRIFLSDLGESIADGGSNKRSFINRLVGYGASMPIASLGAVPLLSKRVTGKLKGDDEDSVRYKAFDWIEKNPAKTLGATMIPSFTSEVLKEGNLFADMIRSRASFGTKMQPLMSLGRRALAYSIPLGFAALKGINDKREKGVEEMSKNYIRKEV